MSQPNLNPSPRARFQLERNNITSHKSMIELPSFDRGMDAALLEYASVLAKGNNTSNDAMAMGFKLQGAQEFLMFLKTLAEAAPVPQPRKDTDNLPDIANLKRQ